MADPIDPTEVTPPVQFDKSPAKAIVGTAAGALLILITGIPTVLGFFSAHDLAGAIAWLHQPDGLAWYGAVTALLGTVGWRVWSTVRRHAKAIFAARWAPNDKAVVKGDVK